MSQPRQEKYVQADLALIKMGIGVGWLIFLYGLALLAMGVLWWLATGQLRIDSLAQWLGHFGGYIPRVSWVGVQRISDLLSGIPAFLWAFGIGAAVVWRCDHKLDDAKMYLRNKEVMARRSSASPSQQD